MTHVLNFVDGASAAAEGSLELTDPATGTVFGTSVCSGPSEVDAARTAATRAFKTWRRSTPGQRQHALLKIADAVEARADAEVRETGKIRAVALDEEIPECVRALTDAACP